MKLDNGKVVKVVKEVVVASNKARDFHHPCVVRAANGDLLVSHKDSLVHDGGDCYVHQWRSADNGFTWKDDGPAADLRAPELGAKEIGACSGEYGNTPDGNLVMFVQRAFMVPGIAQPFVGSTWSISSDNGKRWIDQGVVDKEDRLAALVFRSVVIRDGVMYSATVGLTNSSLYVSSDNGKSWQRRSIIFPAGTDTYKSSPSFPHYAHVIFCPNGDLLAMSYGQKTYSCRSKDNGKTWGPVKTEPFVLAAPRMKVLDENTLILTGRDLDEKATVAWFSTDNGLTWGHKLVVQRPTHGPEPGGNWSYAYTDSISAGDVKFWVYTSAGGRAIVGVLLEVTKP